MAKTKYVFVTGGVTSSLGKGIISASLGRLLQARGFSVTIQKLDPYINVDPGTLNPYEHGECYVTDDGAETDLDLGLPCVLGQPSEFTWRSAPALLVSNICRPYDPLFRQTPGLKSAL